MSKPTLKLARKERKNFTATVLIRGHGDDFVQLEMVTGARYITHKGDRFFLMPQTTRDLGNGNWAKCYLWDGWADKRLKEIGIAQG